VLRGHVSCPTGGHSDLRVAERIAGFDSDGDGLITFADLNNPAFALNAAGACLGGPAPLDCDRDGDGTVTPLDLIDGVAGNARADDLVGWDFAGNYNLPQTGNTGCAGRRFRALRFPWTRHIVCGSIF
jgi:hypothetical protein